MGGGSADFGGFLARLGPAGRVIDAVIAVDP
jgi:hypothetical protein